MLHLGGQSSAGVEKLTFALPEEWEDKTVTLHIKQMDGTLPTPVLLDEEHSVDVNRAFTASASGLWMLLALGSDGYRALTRPAKYDCYETLSTEGEAEIRPSQYESFVAQVLESAQQAQRSAQEAGQSAGAAAQSARAANAAQQNAETASRNAATAAENAGEDADRAEAAAKRAEGMAPEDGAVISVNGKGGVVELDAADVGAVDEHSAGYVKSIQLTGRTLTLTFGDGSTRTMTTQDTADLTVMNGVLSVEHGGTGKSSALTAADIGAVASIYLTEPHSGTLFVDYGVNAGEVAERLDVYSLPAATKTMLGGVKVGSNLTVSTDGTLSVSKDNVTSALGFTPTKITASTTDLTAGSSALASGAVYLVYE